MKSKKGLEKESVVILIICLLALVIVGFLYLYFYDQSGSLVTHMNALFRIGG